MKVFVRVFPLAVITTFLVPFVTVYESTFFETVGFRVTFGFPVMEIVEVLPIALLIVTVIFLPDAATVIEVTGTGTTTAL